QSSDRCVGGRRFRCDGGYASCWRTDAPGAHTDMRKSAACRGARAALLLTAIWSVVLMACAGGSFAQGVDVGGAAGTAVQAAGAAASAAGDAAQSAAGAAAQPAAPEPAAPEPAAPKPAAPDPPAPKPELAAPAPQASAPEPAAAPD